MASVRLQKFLAECGVGSRRRMEQFITEGRVRVNGQVVTELGRKIDPDTDRIEVNRRAVHAAPKGIMLLNKPRGVVSTMSDPEGRRTVADFLTKHYQSYFPVGRLDWDSTGLMILTNDGEIAERLMHPRYGFERVYHARVEGAVPVAILDKLERGVRLSDGLVKANASILRNDDNTTWLEVRINEGRNRVVRRIFDKLGFPVMKLKRIVYGPFKLGRLQVGQMRVLNSKEYEDARRKVLSSKDTEQQTTQVREKIERPHQVKVEERPIRSGVKGALRDRRAKAERTEEGQRRPGRSRGERSNNFRADRADERREQRPSRGSLKRKPRRRKG